jgi:hypothetical protein
MLLLMTQYMDRAKLKEIGERPKRRLSKFYQMIYIKRTSKRISVRLN